MKAKTLDCNMADSEKQTSLDGKKRLRLRSGNIRCAVSCSNREGRDKVFTKTLKKNKEKQAI